MISMLPRIIPKVCPNFRQGTVTISTLAIFINIKLGVAPRIQFESRRSPLVRSPRELIKTLDRFSKIESLPCFYFIRSCVTLRSNKIVLCSLISKIFFFSLILSVQVSNHSRHNIVTEPSSTSIVENSDFSRCSWHRFQCLLMLQEEGKKRKNLGEDFSRHVRANSTPREGILAISIIAASNPNYSDRSFRGTRIRSTDLSFGSIGIPICRPPFWKRSRTP